MRHKMGIVVAALMAVSSVAAAWEKPGFPRIGGYKIGAPHAYQTADMQQRMSRLDMVVISVMPGWETYNKTSLEQIVRNVKAKNPNTLIFNYINTNERLNQVGTVWDEIYNKVDKEKWWLYSNGTSGAPLSSSFAGNLATNYTLNVPTNSAGERYVEWFPKWYYDRILKGAPSLDGVFTDNFFWEPRVNGDYNRDGVTDDKGSNSVRTWHRQGMRRHVEVLKSLMPGKLMIGNVGGWGAEKATYPEYAGLLNGGVLEHYIGKDWSVEGVDWQGKDNGYGSWEKMMAQYRKVIRDVAEPKLLIFNQLGDPKDYRAFRYGLTSCMMDDGYYDFSDATNRGYGTITLFDEYNVDLGQAVSPPPTVAWKSGVFRRDFQNGIALVNPRGNGEVTVELEKDYRRISGTQDPTVNNGQLTRKVTLKDRDGIILLSTTVTKAPAPPSNLTIQ